MKSRITALALTILATLVAAIPVQAQKRVAKPLSPHHKPDPKLWRIELTPELGGWSSSRDVELRVKIVDPKDPAPPKDNATTPARRSNEGEEGEGGDAYSDGETYVERSEWTQADHEAEGKWLEEEQKRNAWRNASLQVWVNGAAQNLNIRVGYTTTYKITCLNGENHLELFQPESGKRFTGSWFSLSERNRLRIYRVKSERKPPVEGTSDDTYYDDWGNGSLEVLEPDGQLVSQGRRSTSGSLINYASDYTSTTPPVGTYTLRWTSGYRGAKPFRLVIEAVLDGGTDHERRWRFEKWVFPGSGPTPLGTIEVEP